MQEKEEIYQRAQVSSRMASTLPTAPKGYTFRDPYREFWGSIIFWISFYESVLPLLVYIAASFWNFPPGIQFKISACISAIALGFSIFGPLVFLLSAFLVGATWIVIKSINRDCEKNVLVGAFLGGVVGLVISVLFSCSLSSITIVIFTTVIFFPTALGQLGGAWGAWKTYLPIKGAKVDEACESIQLRFGVKQLLIVTIWVALLLTAVRLAGLMTQSSLKFLSTWAVLQVAGLSVVYFAERIAYRNAIMRRST